MANEHIGRLVKIGLGKESVAGTPVAATDWMPKIEGSMEPEVKKAKDTSAYGTIDELRESITTQQMTLTKLNGIFRDKYSGHLLMAAMGTTYPCLKFTMSGGSGTFVVGETVTGGTSSATGVIRRKEGTTLYVSITSGTFQTGETITGGTSSATGAAAFDSALRTHVFIRLNTNNHPSYTLYGVDDVGTYRSPYSMLETLELELVVGDFLKSNSDWKGKKEASTSATPSFTTEENNFLARHASLKLASALSGLSGATATPISSFKMTIAKNLKEYQAFGDVDVASIHNQTFKVAGEIKALFNSSTLKDLVTASTKQAMRLEVINTDVTIGSAGRPTLTIDLAQVSFEKWSPDNNNDELVMQTIGFEAEFSVDDAETIAILLQNTRTTAY